MRTFTLNSLQGYAISCIEWLPKAAEYTGTVICLHGFAGDKYSSVIAAVAAALNQKGKKVITFDWPAHGDSTASSSLLTVEHCINDLNTVYNHCREAAPEKEIECFATSFGGYLAMIYRNKYPKNIARYMLRSPALAMPDIMLSFMSEEQRSLFDAGEMLNFGFDKELLLNQSFWEDLCNYKPLSFPAEDMQDKVFIIHGDKDDVVPLEDSKYFAKNNNIRLCVFHGADHRYKNPGELEQIVEKAVLFL